VIVAAVNPIATRVSFVAGTVFPIPRAPVPVMVAIVGARIPVAIPVRVPVAIPIAVAIRVPIAVVIPIAVAIVGANITVAIPVGVPVMIPVRVPVAIPVPVPVAVAVAIRVPIVVAIPIAVPVVVAIAGASITVAIPVRVPVAIPVPVAEAILPVPRAQGVVVQAALVIEGPKAPSHVLWAFALEPGDALGQLLAVDALLSPATDRLPKSATEGSITLAGRHTRVAEQAAEAGSRSKCSASVRGSVVGPN
jgi:hypothetical protein